jgi:nucleoside-diphosphate-sugar epimerase
LTDADGLRPHLLDVDYVFHIAGTTKARNRNEYYTGNVLATKALLEAAQSNTGLKKFCHISTLSAVGPSYDGRAIDEQAPCLPISVYGKTKAEAEKLVLQASSKLPIVVLRPPTVYGPRDTDVLEMFQWVNRGILPVLGAEDKKLSMIHVKDLARGIFEATASEKTVGETFFISNRPTYLLSEIISLMAQILGKKRARTVRIPAFLLFAVAGATQIVSKFASKPSILSLDKAREILQPHWICSAEKIKTVIGFENTITLEDGLRSTYEWYKEKDWI